MARDLPAVQQLTTGGLLATYTAVSANNDAVVNNGRRFVHVKNASGGSINVTENFGSTIDGQAVAAKVVAIAAGADKFFGPWPASYNQTDGSNQVWIDYSATASVTRAVLELPAV
jgi:hypothetical protein